jgi:hypothetical protein
VATWEEHASNNLESRAQTEDSRLSWQSPAWPVLLPRNEGRTRQEARQEGSFSFYLQWILDFSSHSAQFLAWGCCVRSGRGVEAFCEFAVVSPSVRGRLAGRRRTETAGVDDARYVHSSAHHIALHRVMDVLPQVRQFEEIRTRRTSSTRRPERRSSRPS